MRFGFVAGTAAALGLLGLCAPVAPARAQAVPRIKATVVSFDGRILTVAPEGDTQKMAVGVRPVTRILKQDKKTFADIRVGDFVGATVTRVGDGRYAAREVHIFPQSLQGSGEGLYPVTPGSGISILDATVTATTAGALAVKYRGNSGAGTACAGRAPPPQATGAAVGCVGTASIAVGAATPVIALAAADSSELVPGAVVALSVMAGPDGRPVTPGLTIETVRTPSAPGAASSAARGGGAVKNP